MQSELFQQGRFVVGLVSLKSSTANPGAQYQLASHASSILVSTKSHGYKHPIFPKHSHLEGSFPMVFKWFIEFFPNTSHGFPEVFQ